MPLEDRSDVDFTSGSRAIYCKHDLFFLKQKIKKKLWGRGEIWGQCKYKKNIIIKKNALRPVAAVNGGAIDPPGKSRRC